MGYFDAIASASFKQDADGRHIYFPLGNFGRGYLIPSEQEYQRRRKAIVRFYVFWFFAICSLVILMPQWWLALSVFLLGLIGHVLWERRITHGYRVIAAVQRLVTKHPKAPGILLLEHLEELPVVSISGVAVQAQPEEVVWVVAARFGPGVDVCLLVVGLR